MIKLVPRKGGPRWKPLRRSPSEDGLGYAIYIGYDEVEIETNPLELLGRVKKEKPKKKPVGLYVSFLRKGMWRTHEGSRYAFVCNSVIDMPMTELIWLRETIPDYYSDACIRKVLDFIASRHENPDVERHYWYLSVGRLVYYPRR